MFLGPSVTNLFVCELKVSVRKLPVLYSKNQNRLALVISNMTAWRLSLSCYLPSVAATALLLAASAKSCQTCIQVPPRLTRSTEGGDGDGAALPGSHCALPRRRPRPPRWRHRRPGLRRSRALRRGVRRRRAEAGRGARRQRGAPRRRRCRRRLQQVRAESWSGGPWLVLLNIVSENF